MLKYVSFGNVKFYLLHFVLSNQLSILFLAKQFVEIFYSFINMIIKTIHPFNNPVFIDLFYNRINI